MKGWSNVTSLVDAFLRHGKAQQVILIPGEMDLIPKHLDPGFQVVKLDDQAAHNLIEALKRAEEYTSVAISAGPEEVELDDVDRLKLKLECICAPKLALIRVELECPPAVAEVRSQAESAILEMVKESGGGCFFVESSGTYCLIVGMADVLVTEQTHVLSRNLALLRTTLCKITAGRASIILSRLVEQSQAVREYEQTRILDKYRFFCAEWPVISEALLMRDMDHKDLNWNAVTDCYMELLEAILSGQRKRVTHLLHGLFQDHVQKIKNMTFYRVVMTQLYNIGECVHCMTHHGSLRPLRGEPDVTFWSVDDAVETLIRYFDSVMEDISAIAVQPMILQALMLLIKNHDRSMYVGAMAKQLAVSESHLSRVFKQQLGIGIAECLRDMRIYFATTDMLRGERRIKELAQRHGFSDAKYFSKVFRQVMGCTPTAWLRTNGLMAEALQQEADV